MVLSSARYTFDVPDELVVALAELATAKGTQPGEELAEAIDDHVGKVKGDEKKALLEVGAIEKDSK